MDTFFRRRLPSEFYTGDYWGNPWAWRQTAPGGGGITVRRVTKMIEICSKTPQNTAPYDNEDSWLADRITETNGLFPSLEFRRQAIMESLAVRDPYTLHQFWTFMEQYMAMPKAQFIAYWTHLLTLSSGLFT
jgi:hypothetical protein